MIICYIKYYIVILNTDCERLGPGHICEKPWNPGSFHAPRSSPGRSHVSIQTLRAFIAKNMSLASASRLIGFSCSSLTSSLPTFYFYTLHSYRLISIYKYEYIPIHVSFNMYLYTGIPIYEYIYICHEFLASSDSCLQKISYLTANSGLLQASGAHFARILGHKDHSYAQNNKGI